MTDPGTLADWRDFVRARTAPTPVPLVPELRTYQASEVTPLWQATAAELERYDSAPFWAFPWAGGQALARHLLDHPALVAGRRVLDFATGSGLVAIAAARAGAASVVATDLSPFCQAVVPMNAALNGARVTLRLEDLLGTVLRHVDLVVAGDVFYEQPLAERALAWFRQLAGAGLAVLVGDPGRHYSPSGGVERLAVYDVPVSREIEDRAMMRTSVLAVSPR
jgi:predicted nicotinamide N-methyase